MYPEQFSVEGRVYFVDGGGTVYLGHPGLGGIKIDKPPPCVTEAALAVQVMLSDENFEVLET